MFIFIKNIGKQVSYDTYKYDFDIRVMLASLNEFNNVPKSISGKDSVK